jgi:hypothetical protein
MSIYINGYNRENTMKQIKAMNLGYQSSRYSECMYRSDDGNACLVGCFIPDNIYNENMESVAASNVIEDYNLEQFMPLDKYDMDKLQSFHDDRLHNKTGKTFFKLIELKLIDMEKNNC